MTSLYTFGFFIAGLIIGSFLNVVIARVPKGESIVLPASKCPHCQITINWYDNIPVLSYVFLRGKCRSCNAAISIQYPIVELATGLIFAFFGFTFVSTQNALDLPSLISLFTSLAFFSGTLALGVIDIRNYRLPVGPILITGGLVFSGLALVSFLSGETNRLIVAVFSGIGFFVFLWLVHIIFPSGMGRGDANLAALLGFQLGWLGIEFLLVGIFLGFLCGSIWGLAVVLFFGGGRKSKIPFGPSLIVGSWLSFFFGEVIWAAYMALGSIFI